MLVALADELNVRIALVAVDEVAETLERFLFVEGAHHLALVVVDEGLISRSSVSASPSLSSTITSRR